ncbi:hypothetical protein FACS1894153_2070 [Bacteroidia bacterium]|nr:hypothetical protein FACS1894153_2070 [Bacteroidia bacterium]
MTHFTKMQGAGNDYVYIDCTGNNMPDNIDELARKISDRHFGIGSDGLVLICDSDVADFRMRMFNSDGSEAQMCGNASRCVAKYVYEYGLTKKTKLSLETLAGIKYLELFLSKESKPTVEKVCVDMGEPILVAPEIPVVSDNNNVINEKYSIKNGDKTIEYNITCVSMGNPHCIIFVDDVENFDVHTIGEIIENDTTKFPERINVEFVQVIDRNTVFMRVWERGAGETLACGTGACATLVACVLNNKCDRKATVKLIGGDLEIEWNEDTNRVMMAGGATKVFDGIFDEIVAAGGLVRNKDGKYLFIYRKKFWDLPKGKIDVGETLEECALREVEEETGVKNLKIEAPLTTTHHLMINKKGEVAVKKTFWYLMTTDFAGELKPQTLENITKAEWIDASAIKDLLPLCYSTIKNILTKELF